MSDVRYHPNDCGDYHGNRTHKHNKGTSRSDLEGDL